MSYTAEDLFEDAFKGKESLEDVIQTLGAGRYTRGLDKLIYRLVEAYGDGDVGRGLRDLMSEDAVDVFMLIQRHDGVVEIQGDLPSGFQLTMMSSQDFPVMLNPKKQVP